MTIPFTYHVKHIPSGKRYYGVRFAKGCSPKDLWNTYFTSSNKVKELIQLDGRDSFEVEVRKTFKTVKEAIIYEEKVLRRLDVLHNDLWLNNNIAGAISPQFNNQYAKGNKFTEEVRAKLREKRKGKPSPNKGKKCPESAKRLKSEKLIGRPKPPSHSQKLKEIASKRFRVYLPNGKWTWGYTD